MIDRSNWNINPLWKTYHSMKTRCLRPNHPSYKNYGAKGIDICQEWINGFIFFEIWALSNGWKKGLTLDREDNTKGYSPENCRWITYAEQARNTSRNHWITAFGETKCVTDWSIDRRCTVSIRAIKSRMMKGFSAEESITLPSMVGRNQWSNSL